MDLISVSVAPVMQYIYIYAHKIIIGCCVCYMPRMMHMDIFNRATRWKRKEKNIL